MAAECNMCKKSSADLKRCAKCSTTPYCSRECQKEDWKNHKKVCGKQANTHAANTPSSSPSGSTSSAVSPPKGLDEPITKPFTRLDNGTYLHDRPEMDVYRVLIDSYRMRAEDEHVFEGKASADSLYGGARDSLRGFEKYLRLVKSRPGLLPPWWDAEKEEACKSIGSDASSWYSLARTVNKADVIAHYGDQRFPMQLRMFGEVVVGRGFGGQDGTQMRKMMARMEDGGMGGVASMLDVSSGNISRFR